MNWKFWKRNIIHINIECKKIKKPTEDEMLLFTLPAGTNRSQLAYFQDEIKRAFENSQDKFMIIEGSIGTKAIKRPKITNWRVEIEGAGSDPEGHR